MARIAIDAGHGLSTAGKRTLKSLDRNETREWVLNDRVSSALETYLKCAGHSVFRVDDPSGGMDVSLAVRVSRANSWNADYYAAIHHNAGINGGTGGGTMVYVYPGTGGKTIQVQESIYKHAVARAGLKGNRYDGTQTGDFYVLRKTRMPACLVECGFMDSAVDIDYILNPEWSQKIAFGIAEGICEVFGGIVEENVQSAKSYDRNLTGVYTATTMDLKLRQGANTGFGVMEAMDKGEKVHCYGYYTKEPDGTIWLYVVYNGKTGFVSKAFLKQEA